MDCSPVTRHYRVRLGACGIGHDEVFAQMEGTLVFEVPERQLIG